MTKEAYTTSAYGKRDVLWREKKPLLQAIDFELTERCNNNCIHCCINEPQNSGEVMRRELSSQEWKHLLDQAANLGALTVRFTGGEPLLREDFADLYMYARRLGMRVMLFTNARLISVELADLFSRIPPLEAIEVTVYGMKEESYESVSRSPGSYLEYKRGIELLLEKKIPFIVKGVLFPQTISEMDEFFAWAKTIPAMRDLPSLAMFLELRHRRDSEHKNRRIAQLRIEPEKAMEILALKPDLYRRETSRFCMKFLDEPSKKIFTCNAGNKICVDAYGKIQFCLGLRHPQTTVDSRCCSLEEVLKVKVPQLRELVSGNPSFIEKCGRCFIRSLCEQCPVKSWTEHGDLDTPVEYNCRIAHEQAVYIGLLVRGEKAWKVRDWKKRLSSLQDHL